MAETLLVPLEEEKPQANHRDSVSPNGFQSFPIGLVNLLNTLIGPEILGVANSMDFCGVYVSLFLMAFTASLSYIATILVLDLQKSTGADSINDMSTRIVGRWLGQLVSAVTLCYTFSCNISYLVVGAEQVCAWVRLFGQQYEVWTYGIRRALIVFCYSLALPVALSIPRQMEFIDTASMFAILAQIVFVVSTVIRGIPWFKEHQGFNITCESAKLDTGFFNAIAIYSNLYSLPGVILPQLEPFSPRIGARYLLVLSAFIMTFLIEVIPSTISYLRFGKKTSQIVIQSYLEYNQNDLLMQGVNIGFFLVANACYVIVSLQIMTDLGAMIFDQHDPKKLSWSKRLPLLSLTNGVPVLVAMILPSVRPVFEIGGAFGGCLTSFFFPPLLYWWNSGRSFFHWKSLLLAALGTFGILTMFLGTFEAIVDAIASFRSIHGI
jgi:amino acid permease